ncbi:MAG: type I phosphomannose isomerase catalytic subunit [Kiritimatiellia bacterium]|jgi:mannose-6-phosphate isomerase|nr:mannose-6-phosphate isomerase [Lentisphaerota bacterium]
MDPRTFMPILLQPVYKEYIWGGDRLIHDFRRRLNPGIYAESWEIADHPDGRTRIINGPDAGATLSEAIARRGPALLGTRCATPNFPLLVKLIDARETLSVQVHPDDAAAARHGGEAKSEMWYVLAATPDAHIYSGFKPGVTPRDFEKARQTGAIPALLQRYPARPGMIFNTPGGRVHAIGAGCLLLEVQQDANTTYRLYDWDRLDKTGAPRPLHIESALKVINWQLTDSPIAPPAPPTPHPAGHTTRLLLNTPHYHVEEWTLTTPATIQHNSESYLILFSVKGDLRIKTPGQPAMILQRGTTCLLPAIIHTFTLQPATPEDTPAHLLVIRQP